MTKRPFFLFVLLFISATSVAQVHTVSITPGNNTAICKGQSIRFNVSLHKGSFRYIGSFDGKDYFMDTVSRGWSAARTAAQSIGLDLWNIDSLEENNAVYNMIPLRGQSNTFFWFGLYQDSLPNPPASATEGWKWLDGRSLDTTFKYWSSSPPFFEPDDVFQSATGANFGALGLNAAGARWSDMTNSFPNSFNGHAIAEGNKLPLILEWSTGETNTGTIAPTPLFTQSYFVDITYNGTKVRSNTTSITVNTAKSTASFSVASNSDTCLFSNNIFFNNISVSSDPANTIYEWDFGDGNKSRDFSTTHQYSGVLKYVVTLSATDVNGCATFFSRPLTIKPSPLPPIISFPKGGESFCNGDSVVLTTVVEQVESVSYQWYRNQVITGNGRTLVVKVSGLYSIECKNSSGCTRDTAVNVTVNSLPSKPTLDIVNGFSDNVCQDDSSKIQASSAANTAKFNWYSGSLITPSLLSNTSNDNLYVKGPANMGNNILSKDFFVRSVDYNGCISPFSNPYRITFKPTPIISLSAPLGKTIFCEGDSTQLLTSSKSSDNNYQWKLDLTLLPANDSIYYATQTGAYTVAVTNSFGCTSNSSAISLQVNKFPIIPSIIPFPTDGEILPDGTVNICTGSNISLRTSNINGALYHWFKNGVAMFPPGINSSVTVNAEAKYKVNVILNGCSSPSAETTIGLLPLPNGTLVAPSSNSICEGFTKQLSATGAFGYQWYFDNNKLIGESKEIHLASGPGLYKVEFLTDKGCKKMSANFINLVSIKKPASLFSYDLYCVNVGSSFTNKSQTANSGSVSYLWRFQNGKVDTNFNAVHVFPVSGSYRVVLKIIPKDCPQLADSSSITIPIEFPPKGISYTEINALVGKPISLVARSIGNVYQWKPTTGLNSAFIRTPILTPKTEQLYTVNITNRAGCNFVDSQLVRIFNEPEIYVPGGFTPNRDGNNDRVYPIAVGISVFYSIKIFNRWGNMIFSTDSLDPQMGWDGTYKGKDQPADTYTWIVYGIGQAGQPISKSGSVVLIR